MKLKIAKDSGIRFGGTMLKFGGSAIQTMEKKIRTGIRSQTEGEEDDENQDTSYLSELTRQERRMLQKMSPRQRRRYERMTNQQKTVNEWQYTVLDAKKGNSPVPGSGQAKETGATVPGIYTGTETSAATTAAAGATGTATAATTTAAAGASDAAAGSAAGSTAAGAAGSAAGSAAAGAATAGASVAVTATVGAAKKVAGKIRDDLSAAMEEGSAKLTDFLEDRKEERSRKSDKKKKNDDDSGATGIIQGIIAAAFLILIGMAGYLFGETPGVSSSEPAIVIAASEELEDADLTIGGYRYKNWYGMDDNWCAMFVSYCADRCGFIESGVMPKTASVANMKAWYEKRGLYYPATAIPKAGDIIFFGNGMSHVAIVTGYDSATDQLTIIEGNAGSSTTNPYHKGSRVKKSTLSRSYKYIVGYAVPEYPADAEVRPAEEDVPESGTQKGGE